MRWNRRIEQILGRLTDPLVESYEREPQDSDLRDSKKQRRMPSGQESR